MWCVSVVPPHESQVQSQPIFHQKPGGTVMAMDPRTVAIHEAGHAVMQWFVGWEADLQFIQMRRVDGGVEKSFMKIPVPDRTTYADERVARRKLLVLLAGAATTDDPTAQHNHSDFDEA